MTVLGSLLRDVFGVFLVTSSFISWAAGRAKPLVLLEDPLTRKKHCITLQYKRRPCHEAKPDHQDP